MNYSLVSQGLVNTYNCAQNFLRNKGNCLEINKTNRFLAYQSSTFINITVGQSQVLLKQGYNLITANDLGLNNFIVRTGQLIFIEFNTGRIAVDTSGVILSDYIFESNQFSKLSGSGQNWRLFINAIVSPLNKTLSLFKKYTTAGTYLVQAKLKNIEGNTFQNISQSVMVQTIIRNLQVTTTSGIPTCFTTFPCSFTAKTTSGSNINYNWTIIGNMTSNNTLTSQPNLNFQFPGPGSFTILIFAYNNVSSQTANLTITVLDKIAGLSFKAGTLLNSSSIVGQNAQFLFLLLIGQNYWCLIDYGDGSNQNISDVVASPNNTYIPHLYNQENSYFVKVNCSSPVNSLYLEFYHFVQYPLTGLKLIKNGTTTGTSYTVDFSLQSGSTPNQIIFLFDETADPGLKYSNLVGQSSQKSAETNPIIHYIYIYISNYVSFVELNQTFEISTSIKNVLFNVAPTSEITTYTYFYPKSLNFTLSMSGGSNVDIFINFDSLNNPSTLKNTTLHIKTFGDWLLYTNNITNQPYLIPYDYLNPGRYTASVNVSNVLNYFLFNQPIVLMTKVDYLIPQLANNAKNLVIFDQTTEQGSAQFSFSYQGFTKAGFEAYVTFWPGDASNSTFGPYPLSMDFNKNTSRAALSYTYSSLGIYQAVFYVTNSLGSKWFTYTVEVVVGISGFYMSVSPLNAKVGTNVTVSAFLVQGSNVTYNWFCDGNSFGFGSKTCKIFISSNKLI